MNRRDFLKLLGLGAAASAGIVTLIEPEPVRRFWQVGRNAPIRDARFGEYVDASMLNMRRSFYERIELSMVHGHSYDASRPLTFDPPKKWEAARVPRTYTDAMLLLSSPTRCAVITGINLDKKTITIG